VRRMHNRRYLSIAPITLLAIVAACGKAYVANSDGSRAPSGSGQCGSPPPVASPWLSMSYPIPSATNVPTTIGTVIFAGVPSSRLGTSKLTISSANGTVPVGQFRSAPSPLPSPHATPYGATGSYPYVAVPIATLAPRTLYNVSYTYTDWVSTAPSCSTTITRFAGRFTTH
jgi:hypothetical protein